MNIGFSNIYAYRPHGHAAAYIAHLAKLGGAYTVSLDCRGMPTACYVREYKGTGSTECIKCTIAGLHTFDFDSSQSISEFWNDSLEGSADRLVQSSSYTLTRIESFEQRDSIPVKNITAKLSSNAHKFFHAAKAWIKQNKLDAVILFNGRLDYTRAILDACLDSGIPCVTHERPLYGHGIILNRNSNCSALAKIQHINREFSGKPLTEHQTKVASSLAAQRLTGGNPLEWKNYNKDPTSANSWPIKTNGRKILVCPSSKNELLGHPDWDTPWNNNTDALDLAVECGAFQYSELLFRFHPSWSVRFGAITAENCVDHYRSWCESRNVAFIESSNKISTKDLIRCADAVILNGSNTILEAGMLGKTVICLGPSPYTNSQSAIDILSHSDIESLDLNKTANRSPYEIAQSTLRYYYSKAAREPLFTEFVRSRSVTAYDFFTGANPKVLIDLITNDETIINDIDTADSCEFEKVAIDAFLSNDIDQIRKFSDWKWDTSRTEKLVIQRRIPHRIIDTIRNLTAKGV